LFSSSRTKSPSPPRKGRGKGVLKRKKRKRRKKKKRHGQELFLAPRTAGTVKKEKREGKEKNGKKGKRGAHMSDHLVIRRCLSTEEEKKIKREKERGGVEEPRAQCALGGLPGAGQKEGGRGKRPKKKEGKKKKRGDEI